VGRQFEMTHLVGELLPFRKEVEGNPTDMMLGGIGMSDFLPKTDPPFWMLLLNSVMVLASCYDLKLDCNPAFTSSFPLYTDIHPSGPYPLYNTRGPKAMVTQSDVTTTQ